jgi:hypothetical protein
MPYSTDLAVAVDAPLRTLSPYEVNVRPITAWCLTTKAGYKGAVVVRLARADEATDWTGVPNVFSVLSELRGSAAA